MISEEESGFGQPTEATLIKQAQAGCQESLNLLLLRHEGLVHLVVQRQWLCTLPYDQAIQDGRHGLWRAILGFDLERKNRFSTYAYAAIMKYVWAAVKAERRRLRREVPLGSPGGVLVSDRGGPGLAEGAGRDRPELAGVGQAAAPATAPDHCGLLWFGGPGATQPAGDWEAIGADGRASAAVAQRSPGVVATASPQPGTAQSAGAAQPAAV